MARTFGNVLEGRPVLTVFDVTKLCQQRCPMCNIRKERCSHLALDSIREHAENLRRFGIRYVFLQGGEPTLRNDLIAIIDIFNENNIKPTVISNGVLFPFELAEAIAHRRCNLSVSLDTLDREKFRKIRGTDDFDSVIRTITNAAKIKNKHGNWSIVTTVTGLSTLDEIKKLEQFARENGFMYAVRPYIVVGGVAGRRCEELAYSREKIIPIFQYMSDRARVDNVLACLLYEEHMRYLRGEKMSRCDAMTRSFLLQETGDFSPCIELPQLKFDLKDFSRAKRDYAGLIDSCNRESPCFYNCGRETGVVWKNKWKLMVRIFDLIRQMSRYGNLF
ncbi:MAG: radical SAM protein [Candidatus Omnitrophica bacterium]|nr:radical SAM protein [Candidatus Omnitrophota bacterium]